MLCWQSDSFSVFSRPTPESSDELEVTFELEPEFEWRLEQLEKDFSYPTAFTLAMYCHTHERSWHDAIRLKRLGFSEIEIVHQLVD